MDRALPGNGHYTDTDTHALDLLRHVLGSKVIATYAHGRAPLPDTGPCSRCGATTTRYGPAGSPLCDQCREGTATTAKEAGLRNPQATPGFGRSTAGSRT